jgi:hypothetical protein
MNMPIFALVPDVDALRAPLRPCETSPRPIPCPPEDLNTRIGNRR